MSSIIKILQDIANQIKEDNQRGKERIPTSESFIKRMVQVHDKSPEDIKYYLEQLKETHHIFIFNVVNPDPSLFVQGVEGYVYADQNILTELKYYLESKIGSIYENTFYKKKTFQQIFRELLPKLKEYNNTEMGRALNGAMMVDEFIRIISSNAFEYTDSWRKEKLYKTFREEEPISSGSSFEDPGFSDHSKVESSRPKEIPNSKWARTVNQFSTKFVLRIHFRKYEFDVVRKLIMTGKINNIEDLLYIRNFIKEMELMKDKDPILKYHIEKMTELRRICQAKINIIRKNNPSLGKKYSSLN
jgi:hypothetical protein